ncbi:efflux RND transporter periplasmic adaptor subunit [Rhodoplanes sp. TEM]|uniref:Efflux RND transporter periplasmic adaptor subunit n=1 Tax=Rhodoplanes tepidamans TaxID=200616 RepID=A0ABT5J819_RHOTP|nr:MULTISPECIES: efflux RND transporter periplasmic adaptor subunit [Rhodoplanes]MDC7785723.1 efflux RND transporter periplasmic adaptor subunit [Rhodoplanes tepidamans]MDC7983357.1 efflux RND transporter periplasmic adaptor subunit [Rhodoplanes sp. TEM]MDQ0354715.1 RND family efflux transporter MFP subunit [Rhodoplanes tepidamans]
MTALVRSIVTAGAVGLSLVLAACGEQNQYVPPPPPKVSVAKPVQQEVTRFLEATGSTAAVNQTDLVARVAGFVQGISYGDGDYVKQGQLLFTIEPEPYRVKVEQAKAAELGAEANLKQQQIVYDRQVDLVAKQASPQSLLDQATAARDSAQSNLDQSKANTQLAVINQGYTHVTAPFDGVVTARQVSLGQYVGANGQPTTLATIVQLEPIYVNFTISETDVQRIRDEMQRRGLTRDDIRKVPIEIATQTDTGWPHVGTLDYVSPSVTASTGTLQARAILANQDRGLLPGYFVRVRVPIERIRSALLVPDTAIGSDQGGRYVLVVAADGTVEQRKVEVGPQVGELRVIEKGLSADDRVVVAGSLRAVPGQKVDPQATTIAAPPPASLPAAPPAPPPLPNTLPAAPKVGEPALPPSPSPAPPAVPGGLPRPRTMQ